MYIFFYPFFPTTSVNVLVQDKVWVQFFFQLLVITTENYLFTFKYKVSHRRMEMTENEEIKVFHLAYILKQLENYKW